MAGKDAPKRCYVPSVQAAIVTLGALKRGGELGAAAIPRLSFGLNKQSDFIGGAPQKKPEDPNFRLEDEGLRVSFTGFSQFCYVPYDRKESARIVPQQPVMEFPMF